MSRLAGRYTLVRELGRGDTSVVHEAHDDELDQRIAVRVIDRDRLADPRTLERMRREIEAAHRVTHPNVCRMFDADLGAGLCTMELLDGETLAARMARGPIPAAEATQIVAQIRAALTAMHSAGVVHGDVAPRNIVLCGSRAVLIGFGVGEITGDGTSAPEPDADGDLDALANIARGLNVRDRRRSTSSRRRLAIAATLALVVLCTGVAVALFVRSLRPETPSGRLELYERGSVASWLRLDGPGKEMIEGAARDAAGNLYVCGHISVASRLGGRALRHSGGGTLAGVIASFDARGRPRWNRVLTSTARQVAVSLDLDGDQLFVAGRDGPGGFVMALSSSDGEPRWRHRVDADSAIVKSITVGPDGSVYITGDYRGSLSVAGASVSTNAGVALFAAAFDRAGTLRWAVGGSGGSELWMHTAVVRDGAVIVAGESRGAMTVGSARWGSDTASSAFVAAFESDSGALRWVRPLPAMNSRVRTVVATGPLVVAGSFNGVLELDAHRLVGEERQLRGWIAELDPASGIVRWARDVSSGHGFELRAAVRMSDGRLAIAGEIAGRTEIGGRMYEALGPTDIVIAALGADGAWTSTHMRGPGRERIKALEQWSPGELVLIGNHQGITVGDLTVPAIGESDGFLAELRLDQLFAAAPPSASGSR